jgi:hypothetical protein
MSAFITNNPRAPELMGIGEEAIAKENVPCFGSTSPTTTSSTAQGPTLISRRCARTSPPYGTHSVICVLRVR